MVLPFAHGKTRARKSSMRRETNLGMNMDMNINKDMLTNELQRGRLWGVLIAACTAAGNSGVWKTS